MTDDARQTSDAPLDGIRADSAFERLGRRHVCGGDVVRLYRLAFRLPTGYEAEHDVIELPPVVAVVPLLASGEVVLVEQVRHAVEGWMHEIPAGQIERGEAPEDAARRELREETGWIAGRLTSLGARLTIPGVSRQQMHFWLAEELEAGPDALEETECLRQRRIPLADLVAEILAPPESTRATRRVVDSKTHLALLHVAMLRGVGLSGRSTP